MGPTLSVQMAAYKGDVLDLLGVLEAYDRRHGYNDPLLRDIVRLTHHTKSALYLSCVCAHVANSLQSGSMSPTQEGVQVALEKLNTLINAAMSVDEKDLKANFEIAQGITKFDLDTGDEIGAVPFHADHDFAQIIEVHQTIASEWEAAEVDLSVSKLRQLYHKGLNAAQRLSVRYPDTPAAEKLLKNFQIVNEWLTTGRAVTAVPLSSLSSRLSH